MRFIDLFAGIGGFRIAFESRGHKCVFSSEIEKNARKIYENNFGEAPAGNITEIDAKEIPKFDILVGGFPCQTMSISGKKQGFGGKTGNLFFDIVRIAKHHKPRLMVLENVKNITSIKGGQILQTIIDELDAIGYKTYYKVLNGVHFGVPQCRERTYFVVYKKSNPIEFTFPEGDHKTIPVIKDILDDDVSESLFMDDKIPVTDVESRTKKKDKSRKIAIIGKGRQGERIYSIDHPGVTICASGGGIGSKTGLYKIDGRYRKLSGNECRKMFGFPDNFDLTGVSQTVTQTKFGNSVIVPVLVAIIKALETQGILRIVRKKRTV